jgi:hypothetical protein
MRLLTAGLVVFGLAVAAVGCRDVRTGAASSVVRFDPGDVGRPPAGFTQGLTGGGGPVSWVVRADPSAPGGGPVLVQESADDTSYRFPTCVLDSVTATDVSITAQFKTLRGSTDQAAGLVLRYAPENYYVARANALEDNVNLFKTIDGQRLKIAEVDTKVTPGQWHTLGFAARGHHLTVAFDGKPVIQADDDTLAAPGKVGLWTKADSVTAFDELRVEGDGSTGPASGGAASPTQPATAPAVDPIDAAVARAHPAGRVVAVLIADPARGDADRSSVAAFGSVAGAEPVELDLRTSANRAAAARLHPSSTGPTLVCLSPGGLVVSHDDGPVTPELLSQRLTTAAGRSPPLDRQLAQLRDAVTDHPTDALPQMALADFLLAHQADREAIPHLNGVSRDDSVDLALRVRAWVELGKAHLWCGEPEKARHAAQALMATLGPRSPEAMAGGNLVRGLQDTKAKRFDRAHDELSAAVAVAPGSAYGREAAALLPPPPPVGK